MNFRAKFAGSLANLKGYCHMSQVPLNRTAVEAQLTQKTKLLTDSVPEQH